MCAAEHKREQARFAALIEPFQKGFLVESLSKVFAQQH